MMEYEIINDGSGMVGLKPQNQSSYEYLCDAFVLPEYCWLGNICYLSGREFERVAAYLCADSNVTFVV